MTKELQEIFDAFLAKSRAESLAKSDQLSLGELIILLRNLPISTPIRLEIEGELMIPDDLISWRGIYAELALEYYRGDTDIKVGDVLGEFESAVGTTFEGYKGGEFIMSRQTPVWADHYGLANHWAIVGIDLVDGVAIIRTENQEAY